MFSLKNQSDTGPFPFPAPSSLCRGGARRSHCGSKKPPARWRRGPGGIDLLVLSAHQVVLLVSRVTRMPTSQTVFSLAPVPTVTL